MLSIFLLGSLLGVINGFDTPARHALLPNLVGDQRDLRNAVSFHSLVNDTARLLGPVLAGMLIAAWGEGCCFFANGASCLFLAGVLLRLRLEPVKTPLDPGTAARALAEGVRYAWGQASIRSILVLIIGVSFGGSAVAVLMPVMAAEVLQGGPQTLGILMAASGIGALVGAFFLGTRRSSDRLRYTLGGGACLYGLAIAAFSRTTSVPIAVFVLAIAGFGIMIMMASGHTILLTEAAVEKRGRVMSLFTLTFMGTVPFGSLCAGALGKVAGAPLTIGCGAGICLLGGCGFLATGLRPAGVPSGRRG